MRFIKTALCAVSLLFMPLFLIAQDFQSYPTISEVRVEFNGFKSVSAELVLNNVQLSSGMDYNSVLADQSIRSLYGTGYFEFVEVRVEDAAGDDSVIVIFEVTPKYLVERILYSGNKKFSDGRLLSQSELETGVPLDEYRISEAVAKIEAYYVKKGYPDVIVIYNIERNEETGKASVEFEVNEGDDFKIKKIFFEGNHVFEDSKLAKVFETQKRGWLSWLTGTGRFDEAKFKEDLELLRAFYRNRGYLDAIVDEDAAVLDFETENQLYITIQVEEGEQYLLGEMSVENATIFIEKELLSVVQVATGDPFSPEKIDEAASAIRGYYTSRGYLNTSVRARREPNMSTRQIDVVFDIRESEKFYVESINVEGNTITKTRVVIRELALRPGDVFDLRRMETSENRLKNTRYFENVRLNPEYTNIPGRRDLGVAVSEGRTGNLTFGAGFGSIERAVVFFELTQGNFDLFNWGSGFRGDGQKFRVRASIGNRSSQVLVAFEEPWLFEQRLAFGTELFRTESEFNSTDFNELRTGFEFYLRRRLIELVEARMSYRYEVVDIFDVGFGTSASGSPDREDGSRPDDGFADVYQAADGKSTTISKVGTTLLRDTRNSFLFTRSGNRTSFLTEVAGLGGDANYVKLESRTAQFIPTFETLGQTLSIIGRIGVIAPYGSSDEVPFFDRFYLGGPESLRGFEFRDVSPKDEDDQNEAIGGNSYSMVSFEYRFQIAEPLGVVAFYDAGFVNEKEYDFSASNYASNWGVGARILLMGSPLRLDLGFPIKIPDNVEDEGSQFNFSFGTRF